MGHERRGNRLELTCWLECYADSDNCATWMIWDMGKYFSLGGAFNIFVGTGADVGGNNTLKYLIDFEEGKIMPEMESVGFIESYRKESFGMVPVSHSMTEEARLHRATQVIGSLATMIINVAFFDHKWK